MLAAAPRGAGAGPILANASDGHPRGRGARLGGAHGRQPMISLQAARDADLIAQLRADLAAALQAIADHEKPAASPYPNDTIDSIELAMEDAFAENNVDLLLEVIERLLLMGEPGYPLLRRLIEDIAFRGKFLPGRNEFRMDQIYTAGKVFTKHERPFIGFLNYLLIDNRTHPTMRQGAMMGAAFYVGSEAPGSEELRATLMRQFMEEEGLAGFGMGGMPGQMREKMEVMAMMMSNDPAAIPALQKKLKATKDEKMKGDIIGALAYLGDESALPMIQDRLNPQGGDFRKEIDALARIDSPESHETAANFLKNISNSKNFYRHASRYVRAGGGLAGVMLIKERVAQDPNDPDITRAIGTLNRYPTKESLDTLNLIVQGTEDDKIRTRAEKAAEDVQKRLLGEMPAR